MSKVKCPTPWVEVHVQIVNNPHRSPVWEVVALVGPNIDRCIIGKMYYVAKQNREKLKGVTNVWVFIKKRYYITHPATNQS
jgi:hypothetical protein